MKYVLDAGALIAIDRNEKRTVGLIQLSRRSGALLVTSAPVVAQAWRNGARQARLAKALKMVEIHDVDLVMAKRAGELLASTGTSDVVDAMLALLALPMDRVLTSDPGDLVELLAHRGIDASVIQI